MQVHYQRVSYSCPCLKTRGTRPSSCAPLTTSGNWMRRCFARAGSTALSSSRRIGQGRIQDHPAKPSSKLNVGEIDLNQVAGNDDRIYPGGYRISFSEDRTACLRTRQTATKQDYRVTTETLLQIIPTIRPSLTDKTREEFEKDIVAYLRF